MICSWNEINLSISSFLRGSRNRQNDMINVYKSDNLVCSIEKCSILPWFHQISKYVLILSLWLQQKIFWLTSDFLTKPLDKLLAFQKKSLNSKISIWQPWMNGRNLWDKFVTFFCYMLFRLFSDKMEGQNQNGTWLSGK